MDEEKAAKQRQASRNNIARRFAGRDWRAEAVQREEARIYEEQLRAEDREANPHYFRYLPTAKPDTHGGKDVT